MQYIFCKELHYYLGLACQLSVSKVYLWVSAPLIPTLAMFARNICMQFACIISYKYCMQILLVWLHLSLTTYFAKVGTGTTIPLPSNNRVLSIAKWGPQQWQVGAVPPTNNEWRDMPDQTGLRHWRAGSPFDPRCFDPEPRCSVLRTEIKIDIRMIRQYVLQCVYVYMLKLIPFKRSANFTE